MRKNLLLVVLLLHVLGLKSLIHSQDTFSIVAVDTVTGEIGSAGASCVGPFGGIGAYILSDVIEGIGAIHTQAAWDPTNQDNAHDQMINGASPQEIIDYMVANDAQNNPSIRQYGVVWLANGGESAAYTGVNCFDYKDHITAPSYAIQGNIILGQVILDTMEYALLNTPGPLADRLMASLEAAKIIGADTRCESRGTSSQSSFITVVRIGDNGDRYLEEFVPDSDIGVDPIDLLRVLYDQWKLNLYDTVDPFLSEVSVDSDSLPADGMAQATISIIPRNNSDSLLTAGLTIDIQNSGSGTIGPVSDLGNGTYAAVLTAAESEGTDTLSVTVISEADSAVLFHTPVIVYYSTTAISAASDGVPGQIDLSQNYPNPFNPSTTIRLNSSMSGHVKLTIYDVQGREVNQLFNGQVAPGAHEFVWDGITQNGEDAAGGIYFYQLISDGTIITRMMTLVR